jgi:hypothetical protein
MNEVIISRLKQGIYHTFPKNIRSNVENFMIEYESNINKKLAGDPSQSLTILQSNFVSDSSRKYLFVDKSTIPFGGKGITEERHQNK